MPFTLNPLAAATLGVLFGGKPPPAPPPAGDVETRRTVMDGVMQFLASQLPKATDVEVQEMSVTTTDGHTMRAKWYTKTGALRTEPGSAVLYAHGGGMVALTIDHYDAAARVYVSATSVPFLLVDYRRAPEVRAPTPVTDMYAGLQFLVSRAAELKIDPKRIIVMGDSAGGGISASLAHYTLTQPNAPHIAKQILVYPMLDDRTRSADPGLAPYLFWSVDDNLTGWGALLGDKYGTDNVTAIEAAGRATLEQARGLPPAYIDVGELDLFRDEDLQYARLLTNAGVSVEFHLAPALQHAFEGLAPTSPDVQAIIAARVRAILSV